MPKRATNNPSPLAPTCPRCHSRRASVRYKHDDLPSLTILRHRECDACGARWVTRQPPEQVSRRERGNVSVDLERGD